NSTDMTQGNPWTTDSFAEYLKTKGPDFVVLVLEKLQTTSLTFELDWTIDHLCYRCDSMDEYNHLTKTVLPHLGHLLVESLIGGRPIACFKLSTAIALPHRPNALVDVLEVPSPKPGSHYDSGLEHFEMVVPYNLDDFLSHQADDVVFDLKAMSKSLNRDARIAVGEFSVKFHEQTLESVIAYEIAHGLN
ncbi:unnamed protein product, partial [Aphanomyces euteiches]